MMTSDEALAFKVLERFAADRIPGLVQKVIEPLFGAAEDCLKQARFRDPRYLSWADKTDVVDSGFALLKPDLAPEVLGKVTHALFYEQLLRIQYRPGYWGDSDRKPEAKPVMPLAMVESGGLVYMVAAMEKYLAEPTLYRLDRIVDLEVLPERFSYPRDFKLGEYIGTRREFDFFPQGLIRLEVAFRGNAGEHLKETPLSADQTLKRMQDGRLKASGTVMLSLKLRRWLRSLGPAVEVLAPAKLRAEFAEEARLIAEQYGASRNASTSPPQAQ
ncbi:helix-turn-helix transcriptional regulator [Paraburkholderia sp. RL17-337-BIB-A]|uniref:helix-turn-helix transcriptional regulator n=1 Tax=Paraburkholderia sp. RL17-337-BIB-A TaxID=3031636 RepID=UPI0038B81556